MKTFFPEKKRSSLSEKDLDIFHSLDPEIYGQELARKVTEKLKQYPTKANKDGYDVGSEGLYLSHRDYCGVGLYFLEGEFVLGEVYDGMGPHPVLVTFESSDEFVEWLTNQSDQSMSLYSGYSFNNQTITKIRLEYFLEDDYSPVWNSYCVYVRKRKHTTE